MVLLLVYTLMILPIRFFVLRDDEVLVVFVKCYHGNAAADTAATFYHSELKEAASRFVAITDLLIDVIFVCDTAMQAYFPFRDEESQDIVFTLSDIRRSYFNSFDFVANFLSSIPLVFNVVYVFFRVSVLRIEIILTLRVARLLRLQTQSRRILDVFEKRGYMANSGVLRVSAVLLLIFLLNSFAACVYFGLSCPPPQQFCNERFSWTGEDVVLSHFNEEYEERRKVSAAEVYVRATYYMVQSVFTIGYGDSIVPQSTRETLFGCVVLIGGTVLYALLIASMISALANLDVVNMRFRSEMDLLAQYMEFRALSEDLRYRINSIFEYMYNKQFGVLETTILMELPAAVQQNLWDKRRSFLEKVPFWNPNLRSEDFLRQSAAVLQPLVYAPASILLHHGEAQRDLVLVRSGEVQVYVKGNERPLCTLLPGDFVGDFQLLFGAVHPVGLRASDSSFCEVYLLTYPSWRRLLQKFPEVRNECEQPWESQDEGVVATVQSYKNEIDAYKKRFSSQLNTSEKLRAMMEATEVRRDEYLIEPDSPLRVYWDFVLLLATLYIALAVPARFLRREDVRFKEFTVDVLVEVVYLLEMVAEARLFAFRDLETGRDEVVYDLDAIRLRYFSSLRFRLELVCILPVEFVVRVALYLAGRERPHRMLALLRIPKFLRTLLLSSYVNDLKMHLAEAFNWSVSAAAMAVTKMLLVAIVTIHAASVGWALVFYSGFSYHRSLYWAFTTFTTVGYGDIAPDDISSTLFALFVGSLGAVSSAALIANVAAFVHDVEVSPENVAHKREALHVFMAEHGVAHDVQEKVGHFLEFLERDASGVDEQKLWRFFLPHNLLSDIRVSITKDLVLQCDIFKDCSAGFKRLIMLSLQERLYKRQTWIVSRSHREIGMFFVNTGVVDIISRTKTSKVAQGNSFNEWLLLDDDYDDSKNVNDDKIDKHDEDRTDKDNNVTYVRASTDCELFLLERCTFKALLASMPSEEQNVQSMRNAASRRRHSVTDTTFLAAQSITTSSSKVPRSTFNVSWKAVVLTCILWNVLSLPFRVAFLGRDTGVKGYIYVDYIGDLVFVMDVAYHWRLTAVAEDGSTIERFWDRVNEYAKSGKLVWHSVAIPPIEVLAFFLSHKTYSAPQLLAMLRLSKFTRAFDVPAHVAALEEFAAHHGVYVGKGSLRMFKLLSLIFLGAHAFGCIFFFLAYQNSVEGDGNNWATDAQILPDATAASQYIHSLYWAMATLTTVGYGDIVAVSDAEILFNVVVLVFGTLIYTFCVANLEDIVTQVDVTASLFTNRKETIEVFLRLQKAGTEQKYRMRQYFAALWSTQRGVPGDELLSYLPPQLRAEVVLDLIGSFLKKQFFFRTYESVALARLAAKVSVETYLKADVLFYEGEVATTLFYLVHGRVILMSGDGATTYTTLEYCSFGEGEFFGDLVQPCSAVAGTNSLCFTLGKTELHTLLRELEQVEHFGHYVAQHAVELLAQSTSSMIAKVAGNLHNSKMRKLMMAGSEVVGVDGDPFIVQPHGSLRVAWDFVAGVLTTAFIVFIPLGFAFDVADSEATLACESVVQAFFFLDILLRLRCFARLHDGVVVSNYQEFSALYLRNEFKYDAVATLPVYLVAVATGYDAPLRGLLRLFQWCRITRVASYSHTLERFFPMPTGYDRALEMVLLTLTFSHTCACILLGIGRAEASPNWLTALDCEEEESVRCRTRPELYLQAFYWALYTLTTVGYGNVKIVTDTERVFAMVVMVVGAVLCDAGITAVLSSAIEAREQENATQRRRHAVVKRYMKTHQYGKNIRATTLNYFRYIDSKHEGVWLPNVYQSISAPNRMTIAEDACLAPLRRSAIVRGRGDGFIRSMLRRIQLYLAVPDETLVDVQHGDDSTVFVLTSGIVAAVDDVGDSEELAPGSVIGWANYTPFLGTAKPPTLRVDVRIGRICDLMRDESSSRFFVRLTLGPKDWRTSLKQRARAVTVDENYRCKVSSDVQHAEVELWAQSSDTKEHCVATARIPLPNVDTPVELSTHELIKSDGSSAFLVDMQMGTTSLRMDERPSTWISKVVCRSHCQLYKVSGQVMGELFDHVAYSSVRRRSSDETARSASQSMSVDTGRAHEADTDEDPNTVTEATEQSKLSYGDGADTAKVDPRDGADVDGEQNTTGRGIPGARRSQDEAQRTSSIEEEWAANIAKQRRTSNAGASVPEKPAPLPKKQGKVWDEGTVEALSNAALKKLFQAKERAAHRQTQFQEGWGTRLRLRR